LLLGQSCSTRCISFRLRLFSSQTVSLSLLTSSQVFFCLCFGCSFRFGRSLGVSFGLCATLFLDASLGCDPFLLLALQGQHPRVFCHLGCATSSGADRSAPLFADVVVFRTRQEVLGFLQTVRSVSLCASSLRDRNRVACFQQVERGFGICGGRRQLRDWHIDRVLSAFEHVELRVHGLLEAFGFLADDVFRNFFVARANHGKVGLGGDDQPERLQVGGYIQTALAFSA